LGEYLASTAFTSGMTSLPAFGFRADITITRARERGRGSEREGERERENERGRDREGDRDKMLDPCGAFYHSYRESATFGESRERTCCKPGEVDFGIGFTVDGAVEALPVSGRTISGSRVTGMRVSGNTVDEDRAVGAVAQRHVQHLV